MISMKLPLNVDKFLCPLFDLDGEHYTVVGKSSLMSGIFCKFGLLLLEMHIFGVF